MEVTQKGNGRRRAGAVALAGLATAAMIAAPGAGARGSKTVQVADDYYNPTSLSVSKGTKVAFKWVGTNKHNVVKKSGPGSAFASKVTRKQGVQFKHKFKKAGTYKIICTVHPEMKMKVKVN